MYGAILAGGVGTRLWPRSRLTRPKQFTDITGSGRTLIQATSDRVEGLINPQHLYVITGWQYVGLVADQLPDIPAPQIISEPSGRNTAPAIGLACIQIKQRDPRGVVAIMHSDHVIGDAARFRATLARAAEAASAGYLVTIGIQPTFAHTGYGYIKSGPRLELRSDGALPIFAVERFLEKPNLQTAESFLSEGGYYWNGGIFVSRVDRMLAEFERQLPDVFAHLEAIEGGLETGNIRTTESILESVWKTMPNVSIDHGVMEGAEKVAVVPLQAGWNDVGSWDALEAILPRDETGNLVVKGDLVTIASEGNIVYSERKMVALIGANDLVVVDTGDTLLIGHKQQMQSVKELVQRLREEGRQGLL